MNLFLIYIKVIYTIYLNYFNLDVEADKDQSKAHSIVNKLVLIISLYTYMLYSIACNIEQPTIFPHEMQLPLPSRKMLFKTHLRTLVLKW